MKRVTLLFLSLVAIISMQSLSAQNFSVKGKVISEEGNEPLIGVAIVQEGSGNGVITDIDGNYNIEIKGAEQATLTFSYVGMQQQQHTVTANTKTLNIALKSDAQVMDEVVVVAYGVRKKGTIAGSVSTVKSEKLADVPAPSFDQALQGQATGLTVLSQSGEPSALPYSPSEEPTPLIPVLLRCSSWMACLSLVETLTLSIRRTSNPFPYWKMLLPPLSMAHVQPTVSLLSQPNGEP